MFESIGNDEAIASSKYERAIALIDDEDYKAAYALLDGLNYKDSDDVLKSIKPKYRKQLFDTATIGSGVIFGSYEQDNNTSNGKEDSEWTVLAQKEKGILVTSKCLLDHQPYNTEEKDVTWEKCSLRKWLNGSFLNDAFSTDEKAMIQATNVTADKNPDYDTDPGNSTMDKIFLLSIKEANKYFPHESDFA